MGLPERRRFVPCLVMGFTSFVSVLSQCADHMKPCPNGICDKECETSVTDDGVEAIVAIMSVSVILIIGLVILLVYICLKKGPWSQNDEATSESTNAVTCESTTVEIPEYLLRRRFSSLSIDSGPPPYFSLFNFICNENGEMLHTVIGQNFRTGNARFPSTGELPPEYGVLFGLSPPPYDAVVQSTATTPVGPTTSSNAGC